MKNSTETNQSQEIISEESLQTGLSIHEIKTKYNKLNHNLIEVMERFEDVLSRSCVDENDKKYIQKRDLKFKPYTLTEEDLEEHGYILMRNIFGATLVDALHKSVVFFNSSNNYDWHSKLLEYRTEILKIDGNAIFLLKVMNELYESLNHVYNGFDPSYINELKSIYKFNDEEDDDKAFDFDFWFVYNEILAEPNLFSKKKILYEAIANRDMLCLNVGVDPNSFKPNINFKEKCNKAIEIIKFQIDNTLENNTTTTKSENKTPVLEELNTTAETELNIKNPEFTTSRQVLALYYLLDAIDKSTNSIDRTIKARFIHFLTGKNESNIYKTLSEPHKGLENEKNKRSAIKDLEFIKKHFDELGLKSISQKITNDMANS